MESNAQNTVGPSGRRQYGVKDKPLFLSGLMFLGLGLVTIAIARNYPLGTAADMGPGYFPIALAMVLVVLGATSMIIAVQASVEKQLPPLPWMPALSIAAGVLGFGLLVGRFGLVIASLFLLVSIGYQRIRTRPVEFLVITIVLILFSSLVFVKFLGIPLELWP